jgi:hypothetical protein
VPILLAIGELGHYQKGGQYMKKKDYISFLLLLSLFILNGCTEIIALNNTTILRYEFTTIFILFLGGISLFICGLLVVKKYLPQRWRQMPSLRRKLKSTFRLIAIPIAGIILIILVVPFSWYRVEVNTNYLKINEFPNKRQITKNEIETIEVIAGDSGERLHILLKDGSEYFINAAEVGSQNFQKIVAAIQKFKKTN